MPEVQVSADEAATAGFYLLRDYIRQEAGPNVAALQQNAVNLGNFSKSLADLQAKVHNELAAVQQWQGASRTAFDGMVTDPLAAAIGKITPVIQDAATALNQLIGTIRETAAHAETIAEPAPGRPGANDPGVYVEPGSPGVSGQDSYNQMVNLINGMAPDFLAAAKAHDAISGLDLTLPQSAPLSTTDPAQAPRGATAPGKAGAAGQPKAPGAPQKGGNASGAGGQPQSSGGTTGSDPASGDSGASSTPSDTGDTAPLDLAGAPTAPLTTTPVDSTIPPASSNQPNPTMPFVPPTTVPPIPEPKLASIKTEKPPTFTEPNFTEPNFTEPKLAGPGGSERLADPGSTPAGALPVGSTAAASGQTAESPVLAEDAASPAATRGGMPYMPPMGGMGAGMGRGGTEVKPGVAEGPGGPALGPGAGKKAEYAGVPDELRGRSADKPVEQRSRRRRARKPAPPADSSGEVLDEHLWQVERPGAPGV